MHFHWALTIVFVVCLRGFSVFGASEIPEDLLDDEHVREELGVNVFTAPSIGKILSDLKRFQPVDYPKLARALPDAVYPARPQLALNFGVLVGDGFLIIAAEQPAAVEDFGRAMLRIATSLGLRDEVTRYSKSMQTLAQTGRWEDLKRELNAAQREIERVMVRYRDEEVAHLVSVGGWLRGVEILSGALKDDYTPEKAKDLLRLDVLDYFIERISLFESNAAKNAAVLETLSCLKTIRSLLSDHGGDPPPAATVAEINRVAGETVRRIAAMPPQ